MGFRVTGKTAPENVNPAPVTDAALTVTADVPVEVKVRDRVAGVSMFTLPKARLATLTVSCGTGAAVPMPLRGTWMELPEEASLVMVMLPAAAPVAVGSKLT